MCDLHLGAFYGSLDFECRRRTGLEDNGSEFPEMGPLQLGSRDHVFPKKIFYVMGYTLKNARNGESI